MCTRMAGGDIQCAICARGAYIAYAPPMRIFCVACVLAVLHLSCTAASFFSIVTETPPYLRRPGPVPLVLEWDTGDIARQMALSQGVFVNHQVPAR